MEKTHSHERSTLMAVEDALAIILKVIKPLPGERIPVQSALKRVLAEDIYSPFNLPIFANSSMDGFAVRAEDLESVYGGNPVTLSVVDDIPAGKFPVIGINSGECTRIMTGAVLPADTNAVVPVENTNFNERDPGKTPPDTVTIYQPVITGENVRKEGEDLNKGDLVISKGTRLYPEHVGILAMVGTKSVSVHLQPRVAVISTGDELVPPGEKLSPGQLYDSNTYTLIALIEQIGGDGIPIKIAGDSNKSVQNRLNEASLLGVDLIITSAGVSVGAFDFVREVIEKRGSLEIWRVNMRPGKPFMFGSYRNIPVFGLPGNPVSAFMGFEIFIKPAIMRMLGLINWNRHKIIVNLEESINSDGRESYLRAVVSRKEGRYNAKLTGHQGSGNLHSLIKANALLIIPAGVKFVPAGEEIEAWLFRDIIE